MQTLFYITIAYLVSVLVSLITFNIFSFNNKSNFMIKIDFYRILLFSIVPVFNIFLLLAIFGITVHGYILKLINKNK